MFISTSLLFSSRFWGALSKDGYTLSSQGVISHINNQLAELGEQGGSSSQWPYNSGSGWGLLFYDNLIIDDTSSHIARSALPAFEDPAYTEFSDTITSNVNDGYLSLGHVRRTSSGADNVVSPHPFLFTWNNRTISFAHNGTLNKDILIELITEFGTDSSWIHNNPLETYGCGNWDESNGWDCVVDSELYFLWIMKNVVQMNNLKTGFLNALSDLEGIDMDLGWPEYGSQKNCILSDGEIMYAYRSYDSDDFYNGTHHEVYFSESNYHYYIMSTHPDPSSLDWTSLNNYSILILENDNHIIIENIDGGYNWGCTNNDACNYNSEANMDDGTCTYAEEYYDCDGNCTVEDCAGVCGGDAILSGCNNACNSTAYTDMCGICDDDASNDCVQDCAGTWGGSAVEDECGICMGNGCYEQDCTEWPSESYDCDGYNLSDLEFLQAFIDSSNLAIEPLTFGTQTWSNNGRLNALTIYNMFNGTNLGDSLSIPENIGKMDSLTSLVIKNNSSLIGNIPAGIGNLTLLTELNLEYNNLTGTIPDTIQYLVNLSKLILRNNQLMGEIPESICNITAMDWSPSSFSIAYNYLCPPYPDCIEDEISYSSQCGAYPEGDDYPEACECMLTGCTDPLACNYDDWATGGDPDVYCWYPEEGYDCNDNCIVEIDCVGECGGSAIIDDCGNCEGTCEINETEYFGIDITNFIVCSDNPNNIVVAGCDGVCGSSYMVDECGNCYGDCSFNDDGLIVCSENAGIVNSISNPFYVDFLTQCEEYDTGIPCSIIFETAINGDWIQTPDCAGECGGDAVFDECEVCGGDGPAGGVDCDGEPLSLFYGLVPEKFSIHSIYPNPFNPVTSITYGLPEHINVQIIVYDLSGKQVETLTNQLQRPGYHSLNWTAYNLPNGVYIIRMESGDFTQTQKVMLVK